MPEGRRPGPRLPLAEAGLIVLAFALRAWRLGDAAIWWDEGLAVWALRKPFLETTLWTAGDVHPPLFFWTLWPWLRAAGQSAYALRFLTLIWGLLTVALGMALARRLGGRAAGLIAGLLLAVSPLLVWWSSELRMYMLAGLCVLAAVVSALAWLERDRPAPGWLLAYLAAALAAVHTVYLTGVAIAAINLALLGAALSRRLSWPRYALWFGSQLLMVGLFLPWWSLATGRMQSWSSIEAPAEPGFVLELGGTLLATGRSVELGVDRGPTLLFWTAFLVAAAGAIGHWLGRARRGLAAPTGQRDATGGLEPVMLAMLGLFLVLPPLAIWAATQPRSIFYAPDIEARYFLPFAAPVLVLAGWLAARSWQRSRLLGALVLAGLLLPQLSGLPDFYAPRRLQGDLPAMALSIWTRYEPGDVVLLSSGERYPIFLYHYERPWDARPGGRAAAWPPDAAPGTLDGRDRPAVIPFPSRAAKPLGQNDWQERLAEIVASHDRVWLAEVERHQQDPEGRIGQWLADALQLTASERYGPDALHLFTRDGEAPRLRRLSPGMPGLRTAPDSPAADPFLPLAGLPAREALPGDRIHLDLFAERALDPTRPLPHARLERRGDAPEQGGWELAQAWALDPGASAEAWRLRLSLPIDARLPAGDYRWVLESGPLDSRYLHQPSPSFRLRGSAAPPSGKGKYLALGVDYGSLELLDLRLPPGPARAGGVLPIDLRWRSPGGPSPEVEAPSPWPTVFVHLLAAPGQPPLSTADGPPGVQGLIVGDGRPGGARVTGPAPGAFQDRHLLELPPELPAGDYLLALGLYEASTGDRWPLPRSAEAAFEDNVLDGSIQPRLDPTAKQILIGPIRVGRGR